MAAAMQLQLQTCDIVTPLHPRSSSLPSSAAFGASLPSPVASASNLTTCSIPRKASSRNASLLLRGSQIPSVVLASHVRPRSVALAGNGIVASGDSSVSTVRSTDPARSSPSSKILDDDDDDAGSDRKGKAKSKSDDVEKDSGHVSTGGAVMPPPAQQQALREDLTGMDLDSIVQLDSVYNKELR